MEYHGNLLIPNSPALQNKDNRGPPHPPRLPNKTPQQKKTGDFHRKPLEWDPILGVGNQRKDAKCCKRFFTEFCRHSARKIRAMKVLGWCPYNYPGGVATSLVSRRIQVANSLNSTAVPNMNYRTLRMRERERVLGWFFPFSLGFF